MDEEERRFENELRAQASEFKAQEALKHMGTFQRLFVKLRLRLGGVYYLGDETRPDWTGYLPFYLFRCGSCGGYQKDYKHGHRPHVTCYRCKIH